MSELYIGVMSGTSLDGIDVSLCEIDELGCKELFSAEYAYDAKMKEDVLYAISKPITLKFLGELTYELSLSYALAIKDFLKNNSLASSDIKAVGLHGQTLWHEPNSTTPFSMQICDASLVSQRVSIDVVSDFRSADIAQGGQGAPLTPAFHKFMFNDAKKNTAVLNLGGIANLSIIGDKLIGFDTGPANILMDLWIQKSLGESYDAKGLFAKSGKVDDGLLKKLEDETFFKQTPPKSTGRELFNEVWLEEKLKGSSYDARDVQATLLELSIISIKNSLSKFKVDELLVCGGGSKNEYFMFRLQEELPTIDVKTTDEVGVNSDSLEAMAFAWLAYKRVKSQVVDLKDVTGASNNVILGAIHAGN